MKKNYFLIIFMSIIINMMGFSQTYVNTSTTLNGGNGADGITFNVSTNKDIFVTDIKGAFYGSSTIPVELWYNTTAINGKPTINSSNGWVFIRYSKFDTSKYLHNRRITTKCYSD